MMVTNGQEVLAKAAEKPGNVILGSVDGNQTLASVGQLLAAIKAVSPDAPQPANDPAPATPEAPKAKADAKAAKPA
jgi:hypothetical protein